MLQSNILCNKEVATAYGTAIFDAEGVSTNLTESAQMALAKKVLYMTFIPDEKPVAVKEAKAAATEAVAKAEKAVVDAEEAEEAKPAKKAPAKKKPAKKAATKKAAKDDK